VHPVFLAHGHRYVLYVRSGGGLPPGCEVADARRSFQRNGCFLAPVSLVDASRKSVRLHQSLPIQADRRDGWMVGRYRCSCCRAEIPDSEYVFAQEQPDRYGVRFSVPRRDAR
jgi:hypothetical protein